MTEQLKAEAFVREARPALMELTEGCLIEGNDKIPVIKYVGYSKGQHCLVIPKDEEQALLFVNKIETKIIGHPINLQDWLGVLGSVCGLNKVGIDAEGYCVIKPIYKERENGDKGLFFNLTTGQPATEADYKAFNEIVK